MDGNTFWNIGLIVAILLPCFSIPISILVIKDGQNYSIEAEVILAVIGFSILAAMFAIPLWPLVITSGIGFGIWKAIEYAQSTRNGKS